MASDEPGMDTLADNASASRALDDLKAEHATASDDRPQPRLDCDLGNGMTTAVGRLRPCNVLEWKFTVLSHNTIRGAAGAALLNA